jgi:CBS domain-containing protein
MTVDTNIVLLSRVVHRHLVDEVGDRIGRIEDVVIRLGDVAHPPIVGLVVRFAGRDLFVPDRKIGSFAEREIPFLGKRVDLRRFERREGEILLARDLLTRNLINFVGGKLIRAHDVILAESDGTWSVVGVDPARPGLAGKLFSRGETHRVVDFASIEPFVGHVPTAKLRIPYRKLAKLHPAQIADLVEAASHDEGEEIIEAVGEDAELEADVFEELDMTHQVEFLEGRSDEEAARILDRMASDDAADLLLEIDQERRIPVLAFLEPTQQSKVKSLLSYNSETAGGLMSPDFVAVAVSGDVASALEAVRDSSAPSAALNVVYATDEAGHLLGSVALATLVRSVGNLALSEIIGDEPSHVHPTWDLHSTARLMSDFNLTVAPVVDEEHKTILGVVTIDDLVEQLLPQGWRRDFGMSRVEE